MRSKLPFVYRYPATSAKHFSLNLARHSKTILAEGRRIKRERKMKNTKKKKIFRSYHLLTKVESGKCRRVTAAIDVIVTLCRKSVGKRVCRVLRVVSAVTRRQFFVSRLVKIWMCLIDNKRVQLFFATQWLSSFRNCLITASGLKNTNWYWQLGCFKLCKMFRLSESLNRVL